jgi:ParB family chromosome partitioning protein
MGHGRALINIEESEKQLEIYEKIIAQGSLSVREYRIIGSKNSKKDKSHEKKVKSLPA